VATQEELILAQTRAKAADIYKPKLDDEKSGFLQDATAGIMATQAFNESLYAVKGAVKDFERDYRTGEFTDGSLMDRFGRSVFGMKRGDFTGTLKDEDDIAEDLIVDEEEGNLPVNKTTEEINNNSNSIDINDIAFETSDAESTKVDMSELENDFGVGTNNAELDLNGNIVTKPFEKPDYKTFGPLSYQDNPFTNPYRIMDNLPLSKPERPNVGIPSEQDDMAGDMRLPQPERAFGGGAFQTNLTYDPVTLQPTYGTSYMNYAVDSVGDTLMYQTPEFKTNRFDMSRRNAQTYYDLTPLDSLLSVTQPSGMSVEETLSQFGAFNEPVSKQEMFNRMSKKQQRKFKKSQKRK
jgi:hypothetical protein